MAAADLRVVQEKLLSLERSVRFSSQAVSLLKRTKSVVQPGKAAVHDHLSSADSVVNCVFVCLQVWKRRP